MAIVTIYNCDNCEHSQDNKDQMWYIGIAIRATAGYTVLNGTDIKKEHLWCRKCIENLGLLPPTDKKREVPPPPPTFEDLLREVIQDEISASM